MNRIQGTIVFSLAALLLFLCAGAGHAKKTKYARVKTAAELKNYVGKKVMVTGKVSNVIWQHIMAPPETHPVENYFDIEKFQIVVYAKEEISCEGDVKVKGKVIELRGAGKGSKVDETYVEYHIAADKWKCVKDKSEKENKGVQK